MREGSRNPDGLIILCGNKHYTHFRKYRKPQDIAAGSRPYHKEVQMAYETYAQLRDKKGVTDYRVAKDTGIGQTVLSAWKYGDRNPKVDKLQKLAAYFGVPVTVFLE